MRVAIGTQSSRQRRVKAVSTRQLSRELKGAQRGEAVGFSS